MVENPFKKALLNISLNPSDKLRQIRTTRIPEQNEKLIEFGSSILKGFLDIEEVVIKNRVIKELYNLTSATDIDSLIILNEGQISLFNSSNRTFDCIVSKTYSKNFNILDPVKIIEDIFVKAFYYEDRFIDLSKNEVLNLALNVRLKFIESYLDFLIRIYRRCNPDGIISKVDIIKFIISKLRSSLNKGNRLMCFPTLNLGGKKVHASKATADKYAHEMIKMYRNKLKFLPPKENTVCDTLNSVDEGYFRLPDSKRNASLRDLWLSLMKNNFIKNDSKSFKDFKNIFSSGISANKIEWIGTIGELNYFIKLLCVCKPLKTEVVRNQHWNLTLKYFTGQTKFGIPFNHDNLKGAKLPLIQRRNILEKAVQCHL